MIVEKKAGHLAFQFEDGEEFFELGGKVLDKQQIEMLLPGIHVHYNMKDRLLYDVEQYVSLEETESELKEKDALYIIRTLFKVLTEVGSNGFIPLEAVQTGTDLIFYELKEKKAYFIVLPVAKEYGTGDYRSWNKRLWDTLDELLGKLTADKEEKIRACLSGAGKLVDQIAVLIPVLDELLAKAEEQEHTYTREKQKELQLFHEGMYGQFAFYIRKKEFIIGKRRDSVDGYLGVSDAVSRMHCRILHHNDSFFVSDMGSANHTFVNGTLVRAQEEKELAEGDKLRIADIDFKVHIAEL